MLDGVCSLAAQVLSTRAVRRAAGPKGKGFVDEIEASLNDEFEVDLALAAEERCLTAKSKGKGSADAERKWKAGLIVDQTGARSKRGFSSSKGSSSSSGSSVQQQRFIDQGGKALGRFGVWLDGGKGKVTPPRERPRELCINIS